MAYRKYSNSSLVKAIRCLYLSEEMADIHFVFKPTDGPSDRVPAHKNLLIATSEVFRVMFNGTWKEKTDVLIVDASSSAFMEFLQFFYYDEVVLTTENIGQVMNMGQKYIVAECLNACSRFLEYNMTDDNVCTAYELAIFFNREFLMEICEMNITVNTKAVFQSKSFLKCKRETLKQILQLDSMSCSEADVFDACVSWVKTTSKGDSSIQTHLGDAIYDIRFGLMTMEEFNTITDTHKTLFSSDEHFDIVQTIESIEHESLYFDGNPRLNFWDEKATKIDCKREIDDADELEYNIGESISTTFYANTTVLLRGVYCAQIFRLRGWANALSEDLSGKLTIIETRGRSTTQESSDVVYIDEDVRINAGKRTDISLTRPIIIRNGIKYSIQLVLNANFRCCSLIYFVNSELNIECGDESKLFVTFRNDVIKGGKKRGTIYGLQFSKY